jgi:hypothetical protein
MICGSAIQTVLASDSRIEIGVADLDIPDSGPNDVCATDCDDRERCATAARPEPLPHSGVVIAAGDEPHHPQAASELKLDRVEMPCQHLRSI